MWMGVQRLKMYFKDMTEMVSLWDTVANREERLSRSAGGVHSKQEFRCLSSRLLS